jgi:hypothetical protein
MKNGGILTTLDARTENRRRASASTHSQLLRFPVGGDGRCTRSVRRGVQRDPGGCSGGAARPFDEEVFATPAIADGQVFVRTAQYLYCFGTK